MLRKGGEKTKTFTNLPSWKKSQYDSSKTKSSLMSTTFP